MMTWPATWHLVYKKLNNRQKYILSFETYWFVFIDCRNRCQ